MSMQGGPKPFRLMDLPMELRLMIYERLPRRIKHTELRYVGAPEFDSASETDSNIILVTRHIPTALLRTSRQVYSEARDVVAALIRTFVKESLPRLIEYNASKQLLDALVQSISTECAALSTGVPYDMIGACRRNYQFASYPWKTEHFHQVLQFLCQATLAICSTIVTVSRFDLESTVDHLLLKQAMYILRARRNLNFHLQIQLCKDTRIRPGYEYMVLRAPAGKLKLSATNTPVKPVMDKFLDGNSDIFSTRMSQETWVEEWLPS